MKLFTDAQRAQLEQNGRVNLQHRLTTGETEDFAPVVKLFFPIGAATWLISELILEDGEEPMLFGLCDLGMGSPEVGYVTLEEITTPIKGLTVERDLHWTPTAKLSVYADRARQARRIVCTL